jgi:hypothetical protein
MTDSLIVQTTALALAAFLLLALLWVLCLTRMSR